MRSFVNTDGKRKTLIKRREIEVNTYVSVLIGSSVRELKREMSSCVRQAVTLESRKNKE